MYKIKEAIVVEGRYDKNKLAQIIDAPIFTTEGFGIFKESKRLDLLRAVAERRGLIILTDSDGAGFVIRNYLKGAIDPALVKQAYIPDVYGKEKRKAAPGKEGKLGVEGMDPETLLNALQNAGATFINEESQSNTAVGTSIARPDCRREASANNCPQGDPSQPVVDWDLPLANCIRSECRTSDVCPYSRDETLISKADLYELGLTGKPDSRARRLALQKQLGLPEHLSTNALLTALNCITTREQLNQLVKGETRHVD